MLNNMSCNVHKFFRYIMGRWLICYCCRVEPFHIMNLPQSLDLWRIRKHVVTVINLLLSLRFLGNIHDTQTCDMSIWLLGSTRVPSLYRSFFFAKSISLIWLHLNLVGQLPVMSVPQMVHIVQTMFIPCVSILVLPAFSAIFFLINRQEI